VLQAHVRRQDQRVGVGTELGQPRAAVAERQLAQILIRVQPRAQAQDLAAHGAYAGPRASAGPRRARAVRRP
jgi:hypothetical protein